MPQRSSHVLFVSSCLPFACADTVIATVSIEICDDTDESSSPAECIPAHQTVCPCGREAHGQPDALEGVPV
jgi:hypothetical protein